MPSSTESMLKMLKQSIKPDSESKKKPLAKNTATKPARKISAHGQLMLEPTLDEPVNEMKNLLDICLSPQNQIKNKQKPNA